MLEFNLPYFANSTVYFSCIAHEPWAVWLDSGKPSSQYGRFDIMVARPYKTLITQGDTTLISKPMQKNGIMQNADTITDNANPFSIVSRELNVISNIKPVKSIPFAGGALGYFSYDLARCIESLPQIANRQTHIPEMMLGLYDWALVVDHELQTARLLSHCTQVETTAQWQALCAMFVNAAAQYPSKQSDFNPPFKVTTALTSNFTQAHYADAFNKIQDYIRAGDCYQVNLAQGFKVGVEGDTWQAYQALRAISPAPFMAYMHYPQLQVLCSSPERFIQVKAGHVETRPIKGTRPRDPNPHQDSINAQQLQSSVKDRAENLMIVDLLRNDIGKNCTIGSVKAPQLFALESFANVHHLVSTVTGQLATGKTSLDVLQGCFPGGSITGAPKLRAMQIIEELEPDKRGIYCGAIGYIGFDGELDTNISIRTAVVTDNTMRFWAGGGIVTDSVMQEEYQETWDKASSMLNLLNKFN